MRILICVSVIACGLVFSWGGGGVGDGGFVRLNEVAASGVFGGQSCADKECVGSTNNAPPPLGSCENSGLVGCVGPSCEESSGQPFSTQKCQDSGSQHNCEEEEVETQGQKYTYTCTRPAWNAFNCACTELGQNGDVSSFTITICSDDNG